MARVIPLDSTTASDGYPLTPSGRPYAPWVQTATTGDPCRVPGCDRLAGTAFVCRQCVEVWETCLGTIPALVEDLTLAEVRAARFGDRAGGRAGGAEPPMPVDLPAAYHTDRLVSELVGQIRAICDTESLPVPALGSDPVRMSAWLLRQGTRLAVMADGCGLVADLEQMWMDCVATIDTPRRHLYVTQCTCGLAVFARPDAQDAACTCGEVWVVSATRDHRMEVARDYLVTVPEAHGISRVPRNTINQWIHRGRLTVRGDRDGAHLVRFGDVLDLRDTPMAQCA